MFLQLEKSLDILCSVCLSVSLSGFYISKPRCSLNMVLLAAPACLLHWIQMTRVEHDVSLAQKINHLYLKMLPSLNHGIHVLCPFVCLSVFYIPKTLCSVNA